MGGELERFKNLDLVAVAEAYGFKTIRRRGAFVEMRHEQDGDRIDIAPHEADGHPVFKSWNREARGSVIDFVMHRDRCNLGQARRILRHWTTTDSFPSARSSRLVLREHINRAALAAAWRGFRPYAGGYLEARGLSAATLVTAAGRLRLDERGNVAFRHDDLEGLSGWEIKNQGFQGFAAGGRKALFAFRVGIPKGDPPQRLVVTESALDALSFHQYDPAPALLLSFGGGLSNDQRQLLAHVLTKYPSARIVTATDADEEGDRYAATIAAIRPDAVRAKSPKGKDWNDAVR